MRLWSIHPAQLDRVGLVACWREALLAQQVLRGRTRGYRAHPQLARFRQLPDPRIGIASYLDGLAAEAERRGYNFNRDLIGPTDPMLRLKLSQGQLEYEWEWLQSKLRLRAPEAVQPGPPIPHPLFELFPGPVAEWEVVRAPAVET